MPPKHSSRQKGAATKSANKDKAEKKTKERTDGKVKKQCQVKPVPAKRGHAKSKTATSAAGKKKASKVRVVMTAFLKERMPPMTSHHEHLDEYSGEEQAYLINKLVEQASEKAVVQDVTEQSTVCTDAGKTTRTPLPGEPLTNSIMAYGWIEVTRIFQFCGWYFVDEKVRKYTRKAARHGSRVAKHKLALYKGGFDAMNDPSQHVRFRWFVLNYPKFHTDNDNPVFRRIHAAFGPHHNDEIAAVQAYVTNPSPANIYALQQKPVMAWLIDVALYVVWETPDNKWTVREICNILFGGAEFLYKVKFPLPEPSRDTMFISPVSPRMVGELGDDFISRTHFRMPGRRREIEWQRHYAFGGACSAQPQTVRDWIDRLPPTSETDDRTTVISWSTSSSSS
jgi:hypothetical protein